MSYPKPNIIPLDPNVFGAMALHDHALHGFNYFTNNQPPKMVSSAAVMAALRSGRCPSCCMKAKIIKSPAASNFSCCGLSFRSVQQTAVVMVPQTYSLESHPIINTGVFQHQVAMRPGLQLEHHVATIPNSLIHNLCARGIRYVMGVKDGWDFSHFFTLRTEAEEEIFLHLCDVLGYRHIEM